MRIREAHLTRVATLDEYFAWLCELVDINRPYVSYNMLAKALHDKPFKWFVPNDDNRAFEGKNLREQFCEENGIAYVYDYFSEDCSMLELLIALAFRCESIMADQNGDIPMKEWFWMMLGNVGLDKFTDVEHYDNWEGGIVDDILNRIIDRTYHRNGRGGLFPLKSHKKDQRKVELWYQMSSYLVENYYTEDMIL